MFMINAFCFSIAQKIPSVFLNVEKPAIMKEERMAERGFRAKKPGRGFVHRKQEKIVREQ